MTTDPGDLVLDPTCGSGTTAYVAEQWGRRWITSDTSRVALALARTRLMAAKYPYYLLADSPEGDQEGSGTHRPDCRSPEHGTLERRHPPGVRLQARAPRHAEIHRQQPGHRGRHDAGRRSTRRLPGTPRAKRFTTSLTRTRRRVRVTGPFTVEACSARTARSASRRRRAHPRWAATARRSKVIGPDCFATMILDNLRKAGVQNTVKGERLKFDSLDPFAGEWIHAEGHYSEKDGTQRRVAVCIGPEHGTVGPQLVKEAAKEAVRGVGFDVLLVCGFAFDPQRRRRRPSATAS